MKLFVKRLKSRLADASIASVMTLFGLPFTRWSLRKLANHLAHNTGARRVTVGRERLRQLLRKHGLSFQRTKTWKESTDPQREQKLARIEQVIDQFPDRTFAFDEFGPLTIRPHAGTAWAPVGRPDRLPADYRKPHGVRQSTAATASATTPCGASSAAASPPPTS